MRHSKALMVCVAMGLTGLAGPAAYARPDDSRAAIAADQGPSIANFLRIRVPSNVAIAPDGSVYMRDWPDGVNQLYRRAPGAGLDAEMTRLTDFKDGLSSYTLSLDGKTILLSAAVGGNENTNVWRLDTASGQITPILQNPQVQFTVQAWLNDSSGFIYRANDASPRDFYLYRYDLRTGESTRLLAKEGDWSAADITDDGARMLVANFRSISDTRAFELNTRTGELRDISIAFGDQPTATRPVAYLPGESTALLESDANEQGIVRLYVRDLTPQERPVREALPELGARDLDGAATNPERTHLVTVHNEDGFATMRLFGLPDMVEIRLPNIEKGVVTPGFFRGSTLVYTQNNARTPGLAFAVDTRRPAQSAQQITTRMDAETIDLGSFRLPELVKYTSFDGLEIPAFLYLPEGHTRGTPIPFVINFHGGPEAQTRPVFDRTTQYLVSKGFGVLLPNVRGSTGYGRAFHMKDNYRNRWDSVKDGAEAARWLVREGYAKPGKIAAYGGSYGGFMAVATIIEGADVFGASVNIVGIVNFQTFLEQTAGYRRALREAEYGPLSDPDFLRSVSPIHRIDEIKVPMMIAHGLNDPRVPVGEAMQLAVALQARGDDPELLFFPDEGHGFAKLQNRIIFNERLVKFLNEHIRF